MFHISIMASYLASVHNCDTFEQNDDVCIPFEEVHRWFMPSNAPLIGGPTLQGAQIGALAVAGTEDGSDTWMCISNPSGGQQISSQYIVNDNPVNHFWNDTQYQLDDISCTKWISLDDSSFSQATYGYINGVRFLDVDGECIYSWKDSYANLTYPLVI